MIKKWHKTILLEEIDFSKIPPSIHASIQSLTEETPVLEYEHLFTSLDFDFDNVLDQLQDVEDEDKPKYIYQLLIDNLPTHSNLKYVEEKLEKFEVYNKLAQTFNPDHDPKKYSKQKDKEYTKSSEQDWKNEKISGINALRERLYREKKDRKEYLLEQRRIKKITEEEAKELAYMEEFEKHQEEVRQKAREEAQKLLEEQNTNLNEGEELKIEDGFSDFNLDDGFGDFNANGEEPDFGGEEGEFGFENSEQIEAPTEIIPDIEAQQEPMQQVENRQSVEVEKETVVKESEKIVEKEVIKEITDPKLTKRIEELEKNNESLIVQQHETLQKEHDRYKSMLDSKENELLSEIERLTEDNKLEKEEFVAEIKEKQEQINQLKDYIKGIKEKEEQLKETQEALELSSVKENLQAMSKSELRELAEKLTINFNKRESKKELIDKLMWKAEVLIVKYNHMDVEEVVKRRVQAAKEQMLTSEFNVDPHSNREFNNESGNPDEGFGLTEDPFANFEQGGSMDDLFGAGADPFGNLDMGGGMDDMFGGASDPFANVDMSDGMDDAFGSSSDPFANVDTGGGMDDAFGSSSDPFANLEAVSDSDSEFGQSKDPFAISNTNTQEVNDILSLESDERPEFDPQQGMDTSYLEDGRGNSMLGFEPAQEVKPKKKKFKLFGKK